MMEVVDLMMVAVVMVVGLISISVNMNHYILLKEEVGKATFSKS